MAQWRYKPAGSFPVEFHRVMQEGIGTDKQVKAFYTLVSANRCQVEFRIFRYSLRIDHSHPTAAFERKYKHRTRVAYNGLSGMWEVLLTTRGNVTEGMEILP